ncbi:dihydroxy-acid dehydratase [Paramaledivibacter caminithermalis]|jgi:dihydroxy-acid dehydratase|uniref:Dihydroxy-acid dehydratase n=1 Tax=Paramaledivibacter caminithermalis (strain DSM 15212 / CIP 107654 / DViRD3) TaxID=1121301 RepID=A0A1M6QG22_PARC5|nr:dihydroxy-acid dehydratase [Paramaledivibacter caminithermalis]SHK19199.1 dihydroxy-acid dehydratase [Paramaledivibacter caminithermalis DSM 15212]
MKNCRDISDLSRAVIEGRLRTLGFMSEDLDKPIIAIANSYNEIALPHRNLRQIVEYIKLGIAQAGGIGLEFNVIAMCDGISQGLNGMKYVLPSREIIADSIETMVAGHPMFSGLVCVAGCDKTTPGMLMAAARLNIPTVVLGAGPIVPIGQKGGLDENLNRRPVEKLDINDKEFLKKAFYESRIHEEDFIKQSYLKGHINRNQLIEYYADALSTCGLCTSMATANSMGVLGEALGMSLPGSFLVPLVANQKLAEAKRVGIEIMKAVKKGLKPRQIMTREAFRNAMALDMAIGGSMNTILHLLAIANEAGVNLSFDDFDELSSKIPFIVDIKPNGKYNLIELYKSGGTQAVLHEISEFLNLDCINVEGKTMREIIKDHEPLDRKIIYSVKNPLRRSQSIVVLKGNIARNGAIAKSVIMDGIEEFKGEAAVFESENEFYSAAKKGLIKENTVIVIRNEGPKGGPGMSEGHRISEAVRSINAKKIAVITDSRFSGATIGIVAGYISPEAAVGGEIALIKDGDMIRISIKDKSLELLVDTKELENRKKNLLFKRKNRKLKGYLKKYEAVVKTADKGAVTTDTMR